MMQLVCIRVCVYVNKLMALNGTPAGFKLRMTWVRNTAGAPVFGFFNFPLAAMTSCPTGLWPLACPLPSPFLQPCLRRKPLPSVFPSRSCCCRSAGGSDTTSMGIDRPTPSARSLTQNNYHIHTRVQKLNVYSPSEVRHINTYESHIRCKDKQDSNAAAVP